MNIKRRLLHLASEGTIERLEASNGNYWRAPAATTHEFHGAISGRWDENGKLHLRERDNEGKLK